jgi:hypothetical protein
MAGDKGGSTVLENPSALTALQDLRFDPEDKKLITPGMLEKLTALTSLRLDGADVDLVPMVLSSKLHLQHLELTFVDFVVEDYSHDVFHRH